MYCIYNIIYNYIYIHISYIHVLYIHVSIFNRIISKTKESVSLRIAPSKKAMELEDLLKGLNPEALAGSSEDPLVTHIFK